MRVIYCLGWHFFPNRIQLCSRTTWSKCYYSGRSISPKFFYSKAGWILGCCWLTLYRRWNMELLNIEIQLVPILIIVAGLVILISGLRGKTSNN